MHITCSRVLSSVSTVVLVKFALLFATLATIPGFACSCYVLLHEPVSGADPGFLDQGFKLAERGSICAV